MVTLQAAAQISSNALILSIGTILVSMVAFFLVKFYQKVEQIANDVNDMKIQEAEKKIMMQGIEDRLTHIEKILGIKI